MKDSLIAYCGLDCKNCEARIATINNDDELRIKVSDNKGNIFKTYKNDPRLINGLLQKI